MNRRTEFAAMAALVIVCIALAHFAMRAPRAVEREAALRTGVARDLLKGDSRGRQGLVGSAHMTPLPTLIALPFFRLPRGLGGEDAFVLVGWICAALIALGVYRWARVNGAHFAVAFIGAMALVIAPPVREAAASGSSDLLFAGLIAAAFGFMLRWLETRHLRSLAYLSVAVMLALITRWQGAIFAVAALIIVGAALLTSARPKSYFEATMVVLIAPPLYAALLWVAANWLIMQDAGFFLRELRGVFSSLDGFVRIVAAACDWRLTAGLAAGVWIIWMSGRINSGSQNAECRTQNAEVTEATTATTRASRRTPLLVSIAALVMAGMMWLPVFRAAPRSDAAGVELRTEVMPALQSQFAEDWIIIAGYRGYEAVDANGKFPRNIQRTLNFYLEPLMRDTHERRCFLLTPKPEGPDAWEDINIKYPGVFERGTPFTVLERSWDHWRLWRVVRLDATDRT